MSRSATSNKLVEIQVEVNKVHQLSHTANFNAKELSDFLITRRGTTFPIFLKTFEKSSISHVDSATLAFSKDKRITVPLQIVGPNIKSNGADFEIKIPANVPVAEYSLKVKGKFTDGKLYEVELDRKVFILFNPWSSEDPVYLSENDLRQEYVLNSRGRLYIGNLCGNAWNLDLYNPIIFRAVHLICQQLPKLKFEQRADPVLFLKELSSFIVGDGDNGVLQGRWDGNFSDGKHPSFWVGSGSILQMFYESKGKPVKYGQCWVFSGVLLTVMRVLGFPSRSVTNFSSARDSNRNRTIEKYFNSAGAELNYVTKKSESIWFFHTWNEAWMTRPDLPAAFGGWQVVDATPVERNNQGGGFRVGPCPLRAIKDGNSLPYESTFVIAEVNADIKMFVSDLVGVPELRILDTVTVGKTISTKAVGTKAREDITHLYKYPEGSVEERRALNNEYYRLPDEVSDVEVTVLDAEYEFGKDVIFEIGVHNKGAQQKKIFGSILCEAVTYTERVLAEVMTMVVDVEVNNGETSMVKMTVDGQTVTKYNGIKVYLKFTVTLIVDGTSQIIIKTVSRTPKPPSLSVAGKSKVAINEKTKILLSFVNPLPIEMNDVTLNIDFDGMKESDVVLNIGTIGPHGNMKYPIGMTGANLGKYNIVIGLSSDKVELVSGEHEIEVLESVIETPPVELDVMEISAMDLKKSTNSSAHHTEDYDYDGLVIRRGQMFSIAATVSGPLPKGSSVLTRGLFQLVSKNIAHRISFHLDSISDLDSGNTIIMDFMPPANTYVGEYNLVLALDDNGNMVVLNQEIKVVILFNPWSSDDTCHYPIASHLDEYVINTKGKIWVGSDCSKVGNPWQYAQFNKDTLEVALWIIDHMKLKRRSDPIRVSRHITAMVNSKNDIGIVEGNWTGSFEGGTSPLSWTGSGAILEEFNKTKVPVFYGQCFIYAGILTTMLRCVGLATRTITNYNSAHDTNANRAVDKYFGANGRIMRDTDAIWNFHVWNEAYMSRPDLPYGFGGWQVVDATPQELSPQGGGYLVGPSPVRAVKLGQSLNYDSEFVISEVNADVRYYTCHRDGSRILSSINKDHVGVAISTKAIGSGNRVDITSEYKFKEGSSEERATLLAETESEKLIGVVIEINHDVLVGEDFTVTATITNHEASSKSLNVNFYGQAIIYNGAPGKMVKEFSLTELFNGNEIKQHQLNVAYSDYQSILEGGNFINFVCMAYHEAGEKAVIKHENFRLKVPDISIELPPGGLKLHKHADIMVSFKNPLSSKLTEGKFELRGDGYMKDTVNIISTVNPNELVKAVLKSTPMKLGNFKVLVVFSSAQLSNIKGDEDVTVTT